MSTPVRIFEDYDASTCIKPHPLLVGITGPSFSGKSYSAGRIATGEQRVVGGTIYWIDTENDRALELKDIFKFRHVPFPRPKSPLEYLAALEYCLAKRDCGPIIFDNMTHEHIALLDMMDDYMERKGVGDDWEKRDKLIFASMVVPKAQRKRLNEAIVYGAIRPDGTKVPIILLYRAQDKTKPGKSRKDGGDGKPIHKGWQAETSSDLPFYMTARFLLPPGSDGHPNLDPDTEWERLAIKNPQQFRDWFKPGFQLTEEIGERLARWAAGPSKDVTALLGELRKRIEVVMPGSAPQDRIRRLCELLDLPQTKAGIASATSLVPERVRQALAGLGAPLVADPAPAATDAPPTLSAADVEALAAGLRSLGRWSEEDLLLAADVEGVRTLSAAPADSLPRLREILAGWVEER